MNRKLRIVFFANEAIGHTNSCVGIAQELAKRGHNIIFFTYKSFSGHFKKFGFEEIVLDAEIDADSNVDPVKEMATQLLNKGFLSQKKNDENDESSLSAVRSIFKPMFDQLVKLHPILKQKIVECKPDIIMVDHHFIPPCVIYSGIPWVSVHSSNPRPLYETDKLPPIRSGLSINDKSDWSKAREEYKTRFANRVGNFQVELFKIFGYDLIGENTKSITSDYMNIYAYPEELDYDDVAPKPANYFRIDAFLRTESQPFEFPEEFRKKIQPNDKLVYISLGSMGSINVSLMKRIVGALKDTPHKYIVSKGAKHEEYDLPDNMYGEKFLPQTNVLPLVDLVITHGGNNTVTESFGLGKPMIVMPLFGDQIDNAARIMDKKFGIRIQPSSFQPEELVDAVNKLLFDEELKQRLEQVKVRVQKSNSKMKACEMIESLVK